MKSTFRLACVGALLTFSSVSIRNSWAQSGLDNSASTVEHAASPPTCKSCPQPDFPAEARKAKISSALVALEVTISTEGQTDDVRVLSDPGHGFADKAVMAVKKWKFKPAATKDGKKVAARIRIEITFREWDRN